MQLERYIKRSLDKKTPTISMTFWLTPNFHIISFLSYNSRSLDTLYFNNVISIFSLSLKLYHLPSFFSTIISTSFSHYQPLMSLPLQQSLNI